MCNWSMTVYRRRLYVGTENLTTGAEVWEAPLQPQILQTTKPVDTNKPMASLASYRILQAKSLLEEVQKTCTKLKDKEDLLYSKCCADRLDDVTEYIKIAERFFIGGNYIAANYWALKALTLLQEIEECCQQ